MVRPIGHPPRPVPPRAADQRSRAYPTLLRVLRWGRYGHRGGPQTPEVGSLACVSRGPLSSRPPFRCVVCGGGFPVSSGWGGGGGGVALRLSWPCCLCACPRLPWLWFAAGGGGWSPASPGCGSGSWVWLPATPGWGPLVLVGGGPSPLLAEVRRFAGRGPSFPAVGSGWAFPRHSWLRAAGAVSRYFWLGARWCWWWVAPRHSWLRVVGAIPRHSWLGSAGCGGGRFSAGFGGGFSVLRVFVARRVLVCVLCVCGGGVGVGAPPVCVGACVAACGGVFPWLGLAAGVGVGGGVAGVWAVPRHSWRRFLRGFPRHSWLGFAAGGGGCSSPLLAEGPGCGPSPLLAGVRRRRWCVVACPSWVWSWLRFPATPGWGPLAAAVAVCVGLGGGFSWRVCLWRGACARGVCAGACVVCSWWRGCGCVFRVCWCVCVCVWVCGWGRLGLAAGVGVGVVGVCRGWSLATPGGGS